MPAPDTLRVGLKEWAWSCQALLQGHLVVVVRKGGIHEREGGLFSLDHQRFALLPTYLHQRPDRLTAAAAGVLVDASPAPEPGRLSISCWAEVAQVWKVTELAKLLALGEELIWSPEELTARFHYRNQPGLYVVALRIQRLPVVQHLPDLPRYAGCVSWVELEQPIDCSASQAVLDDGQLTRRVAGIADLLARP